MSQDYAVTLGAILSIGVLGALTPVINRGIDAILAILPRRRAPKHRA